MQGIRLKKQVEAPLQVYLMQVIPDFETMLPLCNFAVAFSESEAQAIVAHKSMNIGMRSSTMRMLAAIPAYAIIDDIQKYRDEDFAPAASPLPAAFAGADYSVERADAETAKNEYTKLAMLIRDGYCKTALETKVLNQIIHRIGLEERNHA